MSRHRLGLGRRNGWNSSDHTKTRWPSIVREYRSQVIVCVAATATSGVPTSIAAGVEPCADSEAPGSSEMPQPAAMTAQIMNLADIIEPPRGRFEGLDLRCYDSRYNANEPRLRAVSL